MVNPSPSYITTDNQALLRHCLAVLYNSSNQEALMLHGTIPKKDMLAYLAHLKPRNQDIDLNDQVYVDSWSELFSLGCLVEFFKKSDKLHSWEVGIAIDSRYKESSLREEHLGDGVLICRSPFKRLVFQECKAQNFHGESKDITIEHEVIQRLQAKLEKHEKKNTAQGLIVSVLPKVDQDNKIEINHVYDEVIKKTEWENIFEYIFCILIDKEEDKLHARVLRIDKPVLTAKELNDQYGQDIYFNL